MLFSFRFRRSSIYPLHHIAVLARPMGAIWGWASCPRTLRHADRSSWGSNHQPTPPAWVTVAPVCLLHEQGVLCAENNLLTQWDWSKVLTVCWFAFWERGPTSRVVHVKQSLLRRINCYAWSFKSCNNHQPHIQSFSPRTLFKSACYINEVTVNMRIKSMGPDCFPAVSAVCARL